MSGAGDVAAGPASEGGSTRVRAGRLEGLNVLVTGASRGIGRAVALAMADEGARLTLAATNPTLLGDVLDECGRVGAGSHRTQVLDVTDRTACFEAVAAAEREHGSVDVLVNGAGIYRAKPFLDYTAADFEQLFHVNLLGSMHLMQAVLPGMVSRRSGRIINIASAAGKWASPNQSAYNVSKHALVGLTRCVAVEMGPHQVTVNAICPGLVETDMMLKDFGRHSANGDRTLDEVIGPVLARVALGRAMRPPEVAALAVYLASAEGGGMTGQSLLLDGGMVFV